MSNLAISETISQRYGSLVNRGVGGRGDSDTGVRTSSNTTVTDTKNQPLTSKRKKHWREVDRIADRLEDLFGHQTPSRRPYYCKLAWKLPEGTIWNLAEKAAGRPKLFSWLTHEELEALGKSAGQEDN